MGLFSIWLQSFQEKRQRNYLMRKKGVKRTLSERSNKYFIQVTKKKKIKYTNDEKEMKYYTFISR